MEHCAIDLGGKISQVCIRSAEGRVLLERRCDTLALPELLRGFAPCRVILETAAEAFRVADAARAAGHEVRVVPATLVRTLGVGARRTKTDQRDAQVLSEVSNLRGWLRGQGLRVRSGATKTFAERVREAGKLPTYILGQLELIERLSADIAVSEKRIAAIAESSEICRRLMTVPGVGPSAAVRFVAAIDEVGRFPSAHRLEAYLGLAPGENSSSERQQRLSITKAGPSTVRWALIQSAWILRIRCRRPGARALQLWAAEIEKRRGKCIATVALARRLAGILYALWRDGTEFDPAH